MVAFWILFCVLHHSQSHNSLEIIDQRIILPSAEEMAIQFRVVVKNNSTKLLQDVVLRSEKCCFYESADRSCKLFHPIGEKLSFVEPYNEYSLTILYVNYYVLGRYGECNATLNHDSAVVQEVHFGAFNTTLTEPYTWLPKHLHEWLTGSKKCSTVDQDVSRGCKPVNCIYKYEGRRNYFDADTQICTETRRCFAEPSSYLFGKKLNVGSNTCEKLESNLTQDDMTFLQNQEDSFMHTSYDVKKVKEIICVHGKLNPNNRSCECEFGWFSDPHDHSPYDPITQVYYLCNTHGFGTPNKLKNITAHLMKLLTYMIALMLCACVLSFIFFACAKLWIVYRSEKGRRATSKWFREKVGLEEEARQPLFGSSVREQSSDAKVQHIDTSWYSTEDTIHDKAVVHTKSKGKRMGELYLNPGDIITDLEKIDIPGYWKGTCKDKRGIFPVTCAEFIREGQERTPLPNYSDR